MVVAQRSFKLLTLKMRPEAPKILPMANNSGLSVKEWFNIKICVIEKLRSRKFLKLEQFKEREQRNVKSKHISKLTLKN